MKWQGIAPALVLAALASCGASEHATNQIKGERTVENATLTKLSLTSDAFRDGAPLPTQYTCDGANQSPALAWGEPPQGTKSFALVIDDPDAPSGTFRHWGVYDIPASARSIAAGQRIGTEVTNDFGKPGYGGPCPPPGGKPHRYVFTVYALKVDRIDADENASGAMVSYMLNANRLGKASLTAMYGRK